MEWTNLSDRQKELDRKIERCGVRLDNSHKCLMKVMKAIGARDNEASYVQSRIILRLQTQALLNSTDDFINRTEQMLDALEKDEKEWERRGRVLGFNFWGRK